MKTYKVISDNSKTKKVLEQFVLECNKAIGVAVIPRGVPMVKEMFSVMITEENGELFVHFVTPVVPRGMDWLVFRGTEKKIKKYMKENGVDCKVKKVK